MRKMIMIVLLVPILGILNYSIYEKEQVKKYGNIILLELAPVDPRSLIQGDYMQLRYTIENYLYTDMSESKGDIVIRPDENNVAQFVRFYQQDENLSEDQKLLDFYANRIVPDTFLFQEGHAEYYENAKYGIFKFDNSGNYILTGLADENRNPITPPSEKSQS